MPIVAKSRVALLAIGALCLGLAAGVLHARHQVLSPSSTSHLKRDIGPWSMQRALTPERDPLYVAQVAAFGPYALAPSEAVYLSALTDSEGAGLRADLSYDICGRQPPSRFWSISAYSDDGMFFETPTRRSSFSGDTIALTPNKTFCIRMSPNPAPGNWLPSTGHTGAILVMRLYQADPAFIAALGAGDLPTIRRVR